LKSPEIHPRAADREVTPAPVDDEPDQGARGQVPISVADGDFSTPIRRKRTITRPRGLKTLEQIAALTPSPSQTPPAVQVMSTPGPVAPAPSSGHGASVVDEFLAAPPTPEPEVDQTPTPDLVPPLSPQAWRFHETGVEPESATTAAAMGYESSTSGPTQGVAAIDDAALATPSPWPTEGFQDGIGEAGIQVQRTVSGASIDPPVAEHADGETGYVDNLLEQATAELLASADTEAGSRYVLEFDRSPSSGVSSSFPAESLTAALDPPSASAAPAGPDGATKGAGELNLSPLAQTLANIAEAMQGELSAEPVVEIDVVDAPLLPLDADTTPSGKAPIAPTRAAPPPPPVGAIPEIPRRDGVPFPVPVLVGLPEALSERPRRPKRSKPWFEEVFDESYLRTLPFMTAEQTLREVDFIESSLSVPKGAEVLDVACGYGRHAIELVQRGLAVTGLDLSLPLLIRAADESQRRAVSVNFVHTDMREMSFERQFAGAYCMLTSFGYFDEESNFKVAEGIARALRPGGRFLIDVINRDYVVGDLPARIWWEGDGCVVLEEVDFNFNTNRVLTHRSVVFEDGQQLEQEISLRVYSLHEMGKLLRQAGFRVIEVSGSIPTRGHFFGANSRNLLILAERRAD
jgi:SAM-dependent methyltransferase